MIARDGSRIDQALHEQVEIIEGSHDDPGVLDKALPGADALFWLVPPNPAAPGTMEHYVSFARTGAAAVSRHGVGHVVGVSSGGHGWPKPAGVLSAAFAMDEHLAASGAAYRALSPPFYMWRTCSANSTRSARTARSPSPAPTRSRCRTVDEYAATLRSRGAGDRTVQDITDTFAARDAGIYDTDWDTATITATDFRTWCR